MNQIAQESISTQTPQSDMVTVPGWVLDTLMKDASTYYAQVGEQMGMAGHAASEQLQVEFKAVALAAEALVGITVSPPAVEF